MDIIDAVIVAVRCLFFLSIFLIFLGALKACLQRPNLANVLQIAGAVLIMFSLLTLVVSTGIVDVRGMSAHPIGRLLLETLPLWGPIMFGVGYFWERVRRRHDTDR